ncbi:unnamed protein product, partial [Brachionus calyciflorus]
KKCKCYDFKLPRPAINSTGCESVLEVSCITDTELVYYNGNEIEKCYNYCPNECYQVLYDTRIDNAKYPSKWYTKILNNSTISTKEYFEFLATSDYLTLQQTLLMINIYYENMFYTLIEDSPEITIDLLIAYIGGNFGLFVGISLLSLVEFIEIIFYVIYMFIKRRNFRQSREDTPNVTQIQIEPKIN